MLKKCLYTILLIGLPLLCLSQTKKRGAYGMLIGAMEGLSAWQKAIRTGYAAAFIMNVWMPFRAEVL